MSAYETPCRDAPRRRHRAAPAAAAAGIGCVALMLDILVAAYQSNHLQT